MKTLLMILLSVMTTGWTFPDRQAIRRGNSMDNIRLLRPAKNFRDNQDLSLPVFVVLKEDEKEYTGRMKMKRGGKSLKPDGRIRLLKISI